MENKRIELPWSRFVAVGDSFTEGLGDPEPSAPSGLRGWADRVAETLAAYSPDFAYANLAVRGKLIDQVSTEQIDNALELKPDLISFSAGGNDVIRPKSDPDTVSTKIERAVARLATSGATIILFTAVDVGFSPVFRSIRGKVAIYNENLRAIAKKYDCIVVDQWATPELKDKRYWSEDRLHLNSLGHHIVAVTTLDALGVPHDLSPLTPPPYTHQGWRHARKEDVVWAKKHLVPWVIRRLKRQSSGDFIDPKRPFPTTFNNQLLGEQISNFEADYPEADYPSKTE